MGCGASQPSLVVSRQRENSILAARLAAEAAQQTCQIAEGGDVLTALSFYDAKMPSVDATKESSAGSLTVAHRRFSTDRSVESRGTARLMPEGEATNPSPSRGRRELYHQKQYSTTASGKKRDFELESFRESLHDTGALHERSQRSRQKSRVRSLRSPTHGGHTRRGKAGQVASWKRGELIGCGATGRVYMGLNEITGEIMAVKEIACTEKMSVDDLQAIQTEVDLMRKLNHPRIVQYIGTEFLSNKLMIFTEWVPGGSLLTLKKKFGKLSELLLNNYIGQILEGLAYLHAQGIVHRDIKAANVLVDDRGGIKLADFGSSKHFKEGSNTSEPAGPIRGTPYQMAPEVITQQSHGPKADVWATACTAVFLSTGQHPWQSTNQSAHNVMYTIANTRAPPPELSASSISDQFRDFLITAFTRDVAARPSAQELRHHPFLEDLSSNQSISSADDSTHADSSSRSPPVPLESSSMEKQVAGAGWEGLPISEVAGNDGSSSGRLEEQSMSQLVSASASPFQVPARQPWGPSSWGGPPALGPPPQGSGGGGGGVRAALAAALGDEPVSFRETRTNLPALPRPALAAAAAPPSASAGWRPGTGLGLPPPASRPGTGLSPGGRGGAAAGSPLARGGAGGRGSLPTPLLPALL